MGVIRKLKEADLYSAFIEVYLTLKALNQSGQAIKLLDYVLRQ